LFPGLGRRSQDELPLWVEACSLVLEPWMPGRQIAWLRRSDVGWLAIVLVDAGSANGLSRVTMQLWLEPEAITTDLGTGGHPKGRHRPRRCIQHE
jgi:hypothetical protein